MGIKMNQNQTIASKAFSGLRPAIVLLALLSGLTGLVYPFLMRSVGQLAFPEKVEGSMLLQDGKPIGSRLIGQAFDAPQYFWGRPSATTPGPYNALASGGSNLGPNNPALKEAIQARIAVLRAAEGRPIPVDLVTASASGLDPEISPAAAYYQVARVAKARGIPQEQIKTLVAAHIQARQLGFLGEPRINVLELNVALDGLKSDA
jgi:K+-transporting ATPase ATPase C chain